MSPDSKPHSTLDEAKQLIHEWEDLGIVEQIRHGSDFGDPAIALIKELVEQLETLEPDLEIARVALHVATTRMREFETALLTIANGGYGDASMKARAALTSNPATEPKQ